MNFESPAIDENRIDDQVDDQIEACLQLSNPKSFFLFAGAGSGKTRSLVEAIQRFRKKSSDKLRLKGQKIAVITFTNKACDEIKERLDFDNCVEVRTIHSFVWLLIENFHSDIKIWLKADLATEIAKTMALQQKGRAGTKAAKDREFSIAAKMKRLGHLDHVKSFTYNPNGENRGKDSLNHSEVIKIAADFLCNKPLMQSIMVSKYPVLLIDESQDTNKLLIESFFKVQAAQSGCFSLGLLGDTMQRIYADGKADLDQGLPTDWVKPAKRMNHRCPRRIVTLINKIRSSVDGQEQTPRTDKSEGTVRLFIFQNSTTNKQDAELKVAQAMAITTNDPLWCDVKQNVKMLILEHHMAARRMGFLEMYEPLYKNDRLKIGLLDGSLSGLKMFSDQILPVVQAKRRGDAFAVASVVRKFSPLLSKKNLRKSGHDQLVNIKRAREAVDRLYALWDNDMAPTFLKVLDNVNETGLFEIPENLKVIASRKNVAELPLDNSAIAPAAEESDKEEISDEILDAWDKFLEAPFSQIEAYAAYVNGLDNFDTHQGVKGLEFPRVVVIMDDTEARGFSFNYEKLFGAEEKSKTDLDNEDQGKETGIDRTRRLFYVTCSRAEEALAIVAYTSNPNRVRDYVIQQGWFNDDEIKMHSDNQK